MKRLQISQEKRIALCFLFLYAIFNYALIGIGFETKLVLAWMLNLCMILFIYGASLIFLENKEIDNKKILLRIAASMGFLMISVYLYLVLSTLKCDLSRESLKTLMVFSEQMSLVFLLCKYRKEI